MTSCCFYKIKIVDDEEKGVLEMKTHKNDDVLYVCLMVFGIKSMPAIFL